MKYADANNALTIFKDRKFGIYDEEVLFKFDYFCKRYYITEAEKNKDYSWVSKKNKKMLGGPQLKIEEDWPF